MELSNNSRVANESGAAAQSQARRRALSTAPLCESLEGRQLLSTAGSTLPNGGAPMMHHSQVAHHQMAIHAMHGARGHLGGMGAAGPMGRMRGAGAGGTLWNAPGTSGTTAPTTTAATTTPDATTTTTAAPPSAATTTTTTTAPLGTSPSTPGAPAQGPAAHGANLQMELLNALAGGSLAGGGAGGAGPLSGFGPDGGGGAGGPGGVGGHGFGGQFGPNGGWGADHGGTSGTSTTASTSTSTPTTPATPATPTQLQTDSQKLRTDLQAIHDKSEVTPKELAAVRADFKAIEAAATSAPDATKLATLQTDLQAFAGQLPNSTQVAQITTDFTAVLNSEGVTDSTLIGQALADMQAVVTSSHITSDDLTQIAADRAAIKTDVAANAPAGATGASATSPTGGPAGWGNFGGPSMGGFSGRRRG